MSSAIKAISIDDDEINLQIIERIAADIGLEIQSFLTPMQGLRYAENNDFDIVFVDYMMPEMNGIEFINKIKAIHPDIYIIMITGAAEDEGIKMKALEAGATEFLSKPLLPAEFKIRILNLVTLRRSQLLLKNKTLLLAEEIKKAIETIQNREYESLKILARVSEYRDPETANHIERVSHYSRLLAKAKGENLQNQDILYYASPLHDIGKIGIPDTILMKPGKLTPQEFNIMKRHTEIGQDILKYADSIYLKAGAEIAITHHEKYDGSGYPNSLKNNEIPINGRIVAIADVFDALTSKRPYKAPWPLEKAIDLLIAEKGKHFDPMLIDYFVNNLDQVKAIFHNYRDIQAT